MTDPPQTITVCTNGASRSCRGRLNVHGPVAVFRRIVVHREIRWVRARRGRCCHSILSQLLQYSYRDCERSGVLRHNDSTALVAIEQASLGKVTAQALDLLPHEGKFHEVCLRLHAGEGSGRRRSSCGTRPGINRSSQPGVQAGREALRICNTGGSGGSGGSGVQGVQVSPLNPLSVSP